MNEKKKKCKFVGGRKFTFFSLYNCLSNFFSEIKYANPLFFNENTNNMLKVNEINFLRYD